MVHKMSLFLLLICSCAPEIEQSDWVCATKQDCGSGWVCDKDTSLCTRAWNNQNGVYSDRLVLGSSQPMTGSQADLGQAMTDGLRAYLHYKNKIGGVRGRSIDLIVKDDAYNPQTALSNVQAFLEGDESQRAFAIIGNGGTPTAAVTQPYITDSKKSIFFAPLTGASFLRKNPVNYYMFNFRASYVVEASSIVKYYTEYSDFKLTPAQIGAFAQCQKNADQILVPDSFGQEGIDGILDALDIEQQDLTIGCYDKLTSDPEQAVDTICNWLQNADWVTSASQDNPVDVGIVMVATPVPAALFIQKLKDAIAGKKINNQAPFRNIATIHCGIISPGGNDSTKSLLEQYGTFKSVVDAAFVDLAYTENTLFSAIVPAPWSMSDAAIKYREHLQAYNPDLQAGFVSFEGYLAAKLFTEGLERNGRDLTTDTLVDAFESMTEYNLGIGAPVHFGPNDHEACESVWGFLLSGLDTNGKSSYSDIQLSR